MRIYRPCAPTAPRNHVVWVGFEGERLLVCTSERTWKARDMRADPRVALSIIDSEDPYQMAAVQGRVIEIRSDTECAYMDPIAIKSTSKPFPYRGPDRVCFVIAIQKVGQVKLDFTHSPHAHHRLHG